MIVFFHKKHPAGRMRLGKMANLVYMSGKILEKEKRSSGNPVDLSHYNQATDQNSANPPMVGM